MKIAFNPSTVAALITPPNNKDITFDLRGRNIFARGVKFCGTDTNTWRDIKINNVSIGSNILDLRNGSNTTLTNTNGVVTINSTWRPVVDNLTSDSTTSSLSANQGRVLAGLINTLSTNISNLYALRDGSNATGRWRGGLACFDVRGTNYTPYNLNLGLELHFFRNTTNNLKDGGEYNGVFSFRQWASGSDWTGGKAHLLSFTDNGNIWHRTSSGDDSWETWKKLAYSTDIPSSLKNPYALTISLNGTSLGPYDGSAAKNINITPGSIGAATSGHNHDGRYVYNYGGTQMDGASINKNALGMTTNSGITGDWWHILQAAWNGEYRWNSLIAFPTLNRNGMYYRSGLDDNTAWGNWIKLLDIGNSYVTGGKGVINGTTITQVDNATNANNASVASKVYGQVGDTGSHELVRCDMNNDQFRIIAGSNGNNNGWAEIATADDGNEPIYVRQYTGVFSSVKRTLTLLDANGYTHFPSYINIGGNENNNSSPDRVWGSNGSDSYLRSYRTSALRVSYASSAGNADTLDGVHLNGIFTAFLENGNATRLVIGGVTKDLTIPYSIKSNLLYSYSLPYTNYDKVGWYCKIASVSITAQYSSKTALLCITDEYTVTSSSARYGLIYIKMQQQNALGSSPNVVIRVSGSLTTSLVTGILTLSSTTSKLDIYLKEDLPYLIGYISFIHGAYDIRTNSLELIQTLPSGTIINSQYGDISNQSASLLNSYKINGTSFNGTSDITTAYWGTTRTISLTGAITGSVSTNGGSDITINTTYGTGNITNLDSRYLKRTGDTMSGTLSFSPTEASDAAPKIYSTVSDGLTSLNFEVADDENDRFVFRINYWNDTNTTNRERFTINWNNVISKAPITAPSFNGNATSATKLQTSRLLWGQPFNGTADISGSIHIVSTGGSWNEGIRMHIAQNSWCGLVMCGSDNTGTSGTSAKTWSMHNNDGKFYIAQNGSNSFTNGISCVNGTWAILSSGNVGIGTSSPAYKLHVAGDIYTTTGFKKNGSSDSYVLLGGGGHKLESSLNVAHANTSGLSWDVPILGQHWSRLFVGNPHIIHHSSIFSISGSIGCVVFCLTFLVESNHPGSATIICLFSSSYTQPKMRALAKSDGTVLVDLFWSGSDCSLSSSTQQMTINVIANALLGSISPITTLTNDDTIPNGYSNTCEFLCTSKTSNFYNIRATGNSYATHFYESSDKVLKKNIKSILSSTNIPKIREFDWKDTGEHSYGFIALELEELGYSCLVNEADGKKTVNYTATLALTVAKLLNLINIQNKKISNLTKELKALKYGRKKNS